MGQLTTSSRPVVRTLSTHAPVFHPFRCRSHAIALLSSWGNIDATCSIAARLSRGPPARDPDCPGEALGLRKYRTATKASAASRRREVKERFGSDAMAMYSVRSRQGRGRGWVPAVRNRGGFRMLEMEGGIRATRKGTIAEVSR